jgi:hypothetical protein
MERDEAIRKHVSDMLAVERHILEAIGRQRDDGKVQETPEVNELLIRIERVVSGHVQMLERLVSDYGSTLEAGVKMALTRVLGVAAGIYDMVRDQKLSRMLRDDYTVLSLSAMSYTAMHTFGLTVSEDRVADLALRHLKNVTPLLIEISKVLPLVVAQEVAEEQESPADLDAGRRAVENTHAAWTGAAKEPMSAH